MKKYAIWQEHKVIGYIELEEEQRNQLNTIPDINAYFGVDKVTNPELYLEINVDLVEKIHDFYDSERFQNIMECVEGNQHTKPCVVHYSTDEVSWYFDASGRYHVFTVTAMQNKRTLRFVYVIKELVLSREGIYEETGILETKYPSLHDAHIALKNMEGNIIDEE